MIKKRMFHYCFSNMHTLNFLANAANNIGRIAVHLLHPALTIKTFKRFREIMKMV